MRKIILTMLLFATLAFGFSKPASAAHYTVQKGDSIWHIALKYKIPFTRLLGLNSHYKNPDLIHPGDIIELPDGSTGTDTSISSDNDGIKGDNLSPHSNAGVSTQAEAVLLLVNNERRKQGLNALTLSKNLTDIATLKSKDMAEKRYFSHTSPTYGSPFEMLQKYGVSYRSAGENIAAGQKTANEVMNAWMNSSGHRANILNSSYNQLGVGYYVGGSYGTYWTQMFVGN